MSEVSILWADDEIDLLKPHILFLEEKGYKIHQVKSGNEAVDCVRQNHYSLVFLDENMPGISGLDALSEIKQIKPNLPVVMVTKSEEEFVMDDAIGSQISDYLIKPVNPKQLLLSVKKVIDNKRLVSEKVTSSYQRVFAELSMEVNGNPDFEEWKDIYKKLIYYSIELEKSDEGGMKEVFQAQFNEANSLFSKFIEREYSGWLKSPEEAPVMSHNLFYKKVQPILKDDRPTVVLLLDNFRYDQWRAIAPLINSAFRVNTDEIYYSILPTSTQYARNALFAGMLPLQIAQRFKDKWLNDVDEGGKNQFERDFLEAQLSRIAPGISFNYNKITKLEKGRQLADNVRNLLKDKLSVIVYNFVDLLSHVRTEMEVLKELAEDEAAYRSLTVSWFEHSPLYEIVEQLSREKVNLIITTDHGSVKVTKPSRVIGDKNSTTNLRYKHGKNLSYDEKDVLAIKSPTDAGLPQPHVSSSYIFAKEDLYFVYPNNYNYYVNFFKETFQHGGISMEEVLIPFIHLKS